jgi:MraZ protein
VFRGQYTHSIDAKGRLSLPSRFRDLIAADGHQRVVVMESPFDPCLRIYPLAAWERFEAQLAKTSAFEAKSMRFRRMISSATDCEIDGTGRVLIPAQMRERARLEKEVFCVGMIEFIELWTKSGFEDAVKTDATGLDEVRASLEQLGL